MRFSLLGALLLAIGVGCDQVSTDAPIAPADTPPADVSAQQPAPGVPASATAAPDNSAKNQRDADGTAKTPIDQDENQRDINLTAEIRSRVVQDGNLSTNAHNAKIITSQGKVTLRGPVESPEEKATLERIAAEVAGAANVDSQLEVKQP